MNHPIIRICAALLIFAACVVPAFATALRAADAPPAELAELARLLAADDVDLAAAKLAVDRAVDPALDAAATLARIDALAGDVEAMVPPGAGAQQRLVALATYLYRPGPWNAQRTFVYDLDDPYGRVIRTKLLASYLDTRRGNCVSMPVLFAILAQRLGLDATLAAAPDHLFVKVRGDDGGWINIEATSGGTKSDDGYRRDLGIADEAVASGAYLRPLDARGNAAAMMSTLMEHYAQQQRHALRIDAAKLALTANPQDVAALLHLGTASFRQVDARYGDRRPADADARREQERLRRDAAGWFARAESIGWRRPTATQDAEYERKVRDAKR